jgi:hypothetical protein
MTEKEKLFTARLLTLAAEAFSAKGCADLSEDALASFSAEEWDALHKEYHQWNGDAENYVSGRLLSCNWLWMAYMSHKLMNEVSNVRS